MKFLKSLMCNVLVIFFELIIDKEFIFSSYGAKWQETFVTEDEISHDIIAQ
ncbi:MAG: hypothetical protein ACEY3J_02685 [Arsenophonus sp.]